MKIGTWNRKWFGWYYRVTVDVGGNLDAYVELGFISFHMIKWLHGPQKLLDIENGFRTRIAGVK